jgi:alcohol dehydrogenase class IV
MNFQFEIKTRLHFGRGKLNILGEEASNMHFNKCLIVTDNNINKLGYVDNIIKLLLKTGIKSIVYSGVNKEPNDKHVDEGLQKYKEQNCNGIIAIGGGSVMDAAKAIAVIANNVGHISDYRGFNKIPTPKVPLIAIPTTAGTGSEVTRAFGLTDTRTNTKLVIIDPTVAPEVAIDDPELIISLPKNKTAETGIDALTHAIEAYISKNANPISSLLSIQAIKIIGDNILKTWEDGSDIDARENMLLGQFLAGMAVANAGVCLVHGMGRPLGLHFDVPHGLANAILLPIVMKYNILNSENTLIYSDINLALSGNNKTELDLADILKNICNSLEIPSLLDLDVDFKQYKSLIPKMAEECLASGSPSINPIVPSQNEVERLYNELLKND